MSRMYPNKFLLQLNFPNHNGRVYSKNQIESALLKAPNPLIGLIGECTERIPPSGRMAYTITNLRIEGDALFGDAAPLDTTAGKLFQRLFDDIGQDQFAFAINGSGNINEKGEVSDFTFHSVRLVRAGQV